jgi:hypothetical protein
MDAVQRNDSTRLDKRRRDGGERTEERRDRRKEREST